MSETTNKKPFELAIVHQPLTSHTMVIGYTRKSITIFKFTKGWYEKADIACLYLDKTTKNMKRWVDKKR